MKIKNIYLMLWAVLMLSFLGTQSLYAQNGQFDVKAEADCSKVNQGEYAVKIFVKAHSPATEFNVSEQNYRFSFSNRDAIANPVPDGDGGLEGLIGNSEYDDQTTTGSIDTIVSYNIVLEGGPGVALSSTQWTYVGAVKFDVLDECEPVEILWHDEQPINFPPTFVGEKFNGSLFKADEGDYLVEDCTDPPNGEYIVIAESDCSEVDQGNYYVNFYLQATNINTTFRVSEQNYRFSYSNRDAIANPVAEGASGLEGLIGNSMYDIQHTNGSLDTIVSYNIVLNGGPGVLVPHDDELYVGRVKFDVLDASLPVDIRIHEPYPYEFPPTFVGEKHCGTLYQASKGSYVTESCVPACTPTTIIFDDFENGFGNWIDGGSDCHLYSQAYIPYGQKAARLRDNTNGSIMTTNSLDLSQYDEFTVDFAFTSVGMQNGHDFWFQVSTDGGPFNTVASWVKGSDFENSQVVPIHRSVTIPGPFTANTKLRFRCDASNNANRIHLDDILISGCENPVANFKITTDFYEMDTAQEAVNETNWDLDNTTIQVFPNPASSLLNVAMNLPKAEVAQVIITGLMGEKVMVMDLEQRKGWQEIQINVADFVSGVYNVTLITADKVTSQKVIIID